MNDMEELRIAERLASSLFQKRVPSNELGRSIRLLQTGCSVKEVFLTLDSLARDLTHFRRSGQTQRYAREIVTEVKQHVKEATDPVTAARIIGWARKLLDYQLAVGGPMRPTSGTVTGQRPLPPRGTKRKWR
jgi:hypothetical protein